LNCLRQRRKKARLNPKEKSQKNRGRGLELDVPYYEKDEGRGLEPRGGEPASVRQKSRKGVVRPWRQIPPMNKRKRGGHKDITREEGKRGEGVWCIVSRRRDWRGNVKPKRPPEWDQRYAAGMT